jgi:spermidine/putrescine transport system permease protein
VGTAGALAFARYDWRGRRLYQRFLLLPVFFPQPVLGLALLLTLTAAGITPTWKTAAFAHLVWVVPIVTLIISIRLYDYDPRQEEAAVDLGASRWQVFRYITWPVIAPGVVSVCSRSCCHGAICHFQYSQPVRIRRSPNGCLRE